MTLTLPVSAHALGTILFVAAVVVLSILVYLATRQIRQEDPPKDWLNTMRRRMGLTGLHPMLVTVLAVIWGVLFLALLAGMFWVLYGVGERAAAVTEQEGRDLRWYLLTLTAITASLGAVISLPFTLIRVALNRRQTETAEQGHITDRINTAVQGLGAEKTTSRIGRSITAVRLTPRGDPAGENTFIEWSGKPFEVPDGGAIKAVGDWKVFEETEPNLEVRIGAIYALERIAQDSDEDHVQVMEILCAYIRQNAPAPQVDDWPELEMKPGEDDGPLEADWEERLEAFRNAQEERKKTLKLREDIQVALTVIGRRSARQRRLEAGRGVEAPFPFDTPCPDYAGPEDGHDPLALNSYNEELKEWKKNLHGYDGYRLDLRNANLRGADLSGLNLKGAILSGSHLQGANLRNGQLQGLDVRTAQLQGSKLDAALMQGADLRNAQLQGATFNVACLQGAQLNEARLQGSTALAAKMQKTEFDFAAFQGADLRFAKCQGMHLGGTMLQSSVLQGSALQGAVLWGAKPENGFLRFRGACMQGASLRDSKLHGAFFRLVKMDAHTDLYNAKLNGSAAKSVDLTDVEQIKPHLKVMFGDRSVKLPKDIDLPAHWSSGILNDKEFSHEWRKWQADPENYKPPEVTGG